MVIHDLIVHYNTNVYGRNTKYCNNNLYKITTFLLRNSSNDHYPVRCQILFHIIKNIHYHCIDFFFFCFTVEVPDHVTHGMATSYFQV